MRRRRWRQGDAGVSGSGDLTTLQFTPRGTAGAGAFGLQSNGAFKATGGRISGVGWFGGSATVTP